MNTEIIQAVDKKAMVRAAALIKSGEAVAFPTETVYGLGANAFDESAVAKIFKAKGRPSDNPLIVHLENINTINKIAVGIPDEFYILYEKFMPGPLTVILFKSGKIAPGVTAGLDTVAVRFPRHRAAAELIRRSGCPLAAPSANISSHLSPTTAKHVYDDLNGKIPMIIDGGKCSVGIESTVLDMTGDTPVILRPGSVTLDMLKKVLKNTEDGSGHGAGAGQPKAPGMKYKHYSPSAELILFKENGTGVKLYDDAKREGKRCTAVVWESGAQSFAGRNILTIPEDSKGYAKKIYALLREAESGADIIICQEPVKDSAGNSILNRLNKSAGK